MITDVPAVSNAERQRQFRARNPGYYARIQAAKRASAKRGAALLMAQLVAEHPDAFPAATPDVIPTTATAAVAPVPAVAAVAPVAVPVLTLATTLVLPTAAAAASSPAFEVVTDSPDVCLRIFPATPSDAIAA